MYSNLQKYGRFAGLDGVYFLKGSFFATIQQGFGIVIGLITSYLFGHYISKTAYGEYNLVLSVFSLLTFVSLPALDTPLTKAIADGKEGSFSKTIKARFFASLLGIPLILGFAAYYFLKDQGAISWILIITSFLFPFAYSFQSYQAFFIAKKRFDLVAIFAILSSFFFALFTCMVIFWKPVALTLTLAYLLSMIVPALIANWWAKSLIKKNKIDPHLISYGLFLTFTNATSWISANLGNIILAAMLGVEELATLTVATKYPLTIQKVYTVFSKSITAKIAGQTNKDHKQTIRRHWWKLLLLGVGMFLVVIILLPFLLHFLFPIGYKEAPLYAFWISTTLIPLPLSWVLNDILVFQKRKKAQLTINVFNSLGKLAAYFLVIPTWKTPGMVALLVIEDYIYFFFYIGAFYYYRNK